MGGGKVCDAEETLGPGDPHIPGHNVRTGLGAERCKRALEVEHVRPMSRTNPDSVFPPEFYRMFWLLDIMGGFMMLITIVSAA